MTARTHEKHQPRSYVTAGTWPDGLVEGSDAARVVQEFVSRLGAARGDLSLRALGRSAGLRHSTITRILTGESWPDVVSIVRLEIALDADLWPGRSALGLSRGRAINAPDSRAG